MKIPPGFEKYVSNKFKFFIRGHVVEKFHKGGRLVEVKDTMLFSSYKLIFTKIIHDGSKEAILRIFFITVTWNLVAHSKNTVNIHRNHIS